MNTDKIRELLKKYGAEDKEIENFMQELAESKENVEDLEHDIKKDNEEEPYDKTDEDDEEYLFNAKNLEILKATEEGKKLIIDAPKMAKEELAEAVKKLLSK